MTKIEDKSLLICTWNKSVDVFKKVLLVVSVVVVSLLGLVIIVKGLELFWTYLWTDVYYWLEIILSTPIAFLSSIPWYVYVGAIFIASVMIYSFLWCIAKRLTDEDWRSEEATGVTLTAPALALLLTAPALALALTFYPKIHSFPGAYLHYRRRMKSQEITE